MSGIFPDSGVPPTDANNSLPNPDTVNCPIELWHSTSRCTPRFDPAAANAIMSEILNVMECANIPYDCSKLDNLCTAIKDLIGDAMLGCLPVFPDATGACSIEQIVMITDATGCKKFGRYTSASAKVAWGDVGSWYGPLNSTQRPLDPNNPATFYNAIDLSADALSNTINNVLLTNNALSKVSFTLTCDTMLDVKMTCGPIFNPAQAGATNGARSVWVVRVDGKINLSPSNYLANVSQPFTNFEASNIQTISIFLPAGAHTMEFFVCAASSSLPPVPIRLGHAVISPTVASSTLRVDVDKAVT